MSRRRATTRTLTLFAADSLVRISAPPAGGEASTERGPGFGGTSPESSTSCGRHGSLSKTSRAAPRNGSLPSAAISSALAIERVPSHYLPSTSERPTVASACSWSVPTRHIDRAGTGLLPTPTVEGNRNRSGLSPKSGDGLQTVLGGPLSPLFVEWLMGFPIGWTDCAPSETLLSRNARK
jgi:hypothetical protein